MRLLGDILVILCVPIIAIALTLIVSGTIIYRMGEDIINYYFKRDEKETEGKD